MTTEPEAGGQEIWDAIFGSWRVAALYAAAELRCADHLQHGPLSAEELAGRCGAQAPQLARLLRCLAGMNVVRSVEHGRYELGPAGRRLISDAPGSLRTAVLIHNDPEYAHYALRTLPETLRTGRPAFVERNGHFYEYLAANPAFARLFDEYMSARSRPWAIGLATRYDFSGIKKVVDVGGGNGHILATVLEAHPHITGVLFDLEPVAAAAASGLSGLADRCEIVSGNFFEEVPPADAYVLSNIVHNWSDEDAIRILRNVRAAIPGQGRVLLVELVLPDDDRPHPSREVDLRMLALFGEGRERTVPEYRSLLSEAGLRLTDVIDLPESASIIEAVPKGRR